MFSETLQSYVYWSYVIWESAVFSYMGMHSYLWVNRLSITRYKRRSFKTLLLLLIYVCNLNLTTQVQAGNMTGGIFQFLLYAQ